MCKNIAASNGLMLAEAVSYALSQTSMSKTDASKLVKEASQVVMQEGRHLIDVIKKMTDVPVDWDALSEATYLGSCDEFVDRVLKASKEG